MSRDIPSRFFSGISKTKLLDLVSLEELQEMQDSFAEVASVSIICVDVGGRHLTKTSNPSSLCTEIPRVGSARHKLCETCLPGFLGGQGGVDEELSFECAVGFRHYLVPLKLPMGLTQSKILGYMIIGPVVFMKHRDKSCYVEAARHLGIDLEKMWGYILELRVFSYKGLHSFLNMVNQMMGHILNLAYAKCLMQKKISMRLSDKDAGAATARPEFVKEFLGLFLDLALDICSGNRGSIMLLDRSKQTLVLQVSSGLSAEVAGAAPTKIGEGVAGLAAELRKSFLINQGAVDPLIAERLHQPELFSSVVVPIEYGNDVLGVVNVSSDRTLAVKFNDSTLAVLTRAAGLAGVALQRF